MSRIGNVFVTPTREGGVRIMISGPSSEAALDPLTAQVLASEIASAAMSASVFAHDALRRQEDNVKRRLDDLHNEERRLLDRIKGLEAQAQEPANPAPGRDRGGYGSAS